MSNESLNILQRIGVELLWAFCRLFGMLPLFVQYRVVAPVVRLFVYRVFRYRVGVVNDNLNHAFAHLSHKERCKIRDQYYRTMSHIFVSSIALASPKMGAKFDDPNDENCDAVKLREEVKGRNWIALTAHFGLWEHFVFWGEFSDTYMVGAYHKLKNPIVNELFIRLRTRNHKYSIVLESKQVIRFCVKHREGIEGRNYILGLIADQNPGRRSKSEGVNFLGRETKFFEGGEKVAIKMGLPAYFVYQRYEGNGRYRVAYDLIYDGKESVEPYEITRRYAKRLEEEIIRAPYMWLWSHRRWKYKYTTHSSESIE